MDSIWKGKVALVTGASAGIGAGICRELVKYGMTVIGCARRVEKISQIAEENAMKISPGKLLPIKCDLTDESAILKLFDEIREKFGRLDVCINNAGFSYDAPLLSGSTSDWKDMLDVNVLALCICSREAVKLMQEKGIDNGHIIQISSIGGHRLPVNRPGLNYYCGTKYMVRALTEGLRRELKALDSHIRVGSVSPGFVDSEFRSHHFRNDPVRCSEDSYSSMESLQPKDIADAVIYILRSPPHVEVHDIIVRPLEQAI